MLFDCGWSFRIGLFTPYVLFRLPTSIFHKQESDTKGFNTAENDPANGDKFKDECTKNRKEAQCCADPPVELPADLGAPLGIFCQDAIKGDILVK